MGRVARIGELYDARSDQFLHISMTENNLPAEIIQSTENKHSNIKYLKMNTLEEKLTTLNVQAELKLSVLGGLVQVSGSGKFLSDKKHSSRSVQVSLAASMLTEVESVDFTNKDEKRLIDMDVLEEIDATHVVVGIQWGGNVFISVEDSNYEGSDQQTVAGSLSAKLEMLFASVSASGEVSVSDTLINEYNRYSFEIYGDILPPEMPVTLVDAVVLMKTSARLLTEGNLGKGKAVSYTLLPLELYRQLLGVEASISIILKSINEGTINSFVKWFDEMNIVDQQVEDLLTQRRQYQNYVAKEKLDEIVTFSENYDNYRFQVKLTLAEALIKVRSGNETIDQLINVLNEANNHELSPKKIDFEQFSTLQTEFKFLKFLFDLQVKVLDKGTSFQEFMLKHFNKNIYAFFYIVEFPNLTDEPMVAFRSILEKRETFDQNGIFVAIKIDALKDTEKQTYFDFVEPTRLRLYRNHDCIIENYLMNTEVNPIGESEIWSLDYMMNQIVNINTQLKNPGMKIYIIVDYSTT